MGVKPMLREIKLLPVDYLRRAIAPRPKKPRPSSNAVAPPSGIVVLESAKPKTKLPEVPSDVSVIVKLQLAEVAVYGLRRPVISTVPKPLRVRSPESCSTLVIEPRSKV